MNLRTYFEQNHKGKKNAIKRKELLPALKKLDPDLKDRDMRKDYELLELCGTRDGLFLPATEEEKKKQINRYEKLIQTYLEKIARLGKYQIKRPGEQGRLWR